MLSIVDYSRSTRNDGDEKGHPSYRRWKTGEVILPEGRITTGSLMKTYDEQPLSLQTGATILPVRIDGAASYFSRLAAHVRLFPSDQPAPAPTTAAIPMPVAPTAFAASAQGRRNVHRDAGHDLRHPPHANPV